MNDMAQVIIPKSDQLNADDLITGPLTVKITGVTIRGGQEQPISIHYEGDNGKPYKACKSMCRVMVNAWGPDSKQYVGRSLTLYRDASVKWGGMEVGGIRISHMSDIEGPLTMALTMTKSNRKPFTVKPIAAPVDYTPAINAASTLAELQAVWAKLPKDRHAQYAAAKDARKAALQPPAAPADDFVTEMNAAERTAI